MRETCKRERRRLALVPRINRHVLSQQVVAAFYWLSSCWLIQVSTSLESQPTACKPAIGFPFGKSPRLISS